MSGGAKKLTADRRKVLRAIGENVGGWPSRCFWSFVVIAGWLGFNWLMAQTWPGG